MAGRAVRAALLCASLLLLQQASAELTGRCLAQQACPARATPCDTDEECGQQICCNTTCGRACVDPLYTGCENVKLSSERISRALAAENSRLGRGKLKSVRSPRCRTADGEFEEVQCDNEIVSSCWCVDQAGFEVPGTRAPAASLVNCTRVASCAAHTCRMLCPLGFELDAQGCPLCKCRDPCKTVTCPGQLLCQLEEMACLKPPCPPVPTCKRGRSLSNICPAGEPLLISETSRPFLCGTDPGKPNCPPLYRCLVESGNDYGVCCPASLELQKAGTCPAPIKHQECGTPCSYDLECPSMEKCCDGGECGKHCIHPYNVTMCTQQKMLAELLAVSEREGRGYVPQCNAADGSFVSKQCSRNGLVCWCVDTEGNKLRGSMGPAATVNCPLNPQPARSGARSLQKCARALCAGVCEYGYKTGKDGCPTCECDDPCMGYPCAEDEECVRVRDVNCTSEFCSGYPVCRPKASYENPCEVGVPATDTVGVPINCGIEKDCPAEHICLSIRRSGDVAVCCPDPRQMENATDFADITFESCGSDANALCGLNSTVTCPEGECDTGLVCCAASCGPICVDATKMLLQNARVDDVPTMCEYLRDFDEKMEGTVDGMKLALPAPTCQSDGSFHPRQCELNQCWCVDNFGTEIPETRSYNMSMDCDKVRAELTCLDMTCRMGCDYGFELGANKCPTCKCRDPCVGLTCPAGRACAVVDVACETDYCPPVPACLPHKVGQCPYLVPSNGACDWSCRSDAECGANERCCPTGCGTACMQTVHETLCQQRRTSALYSAAESGIPPAWSWVPRCRVDGSYERVQCNTSSNTCWCVDTHGNEVPGTRIFNSTTPLCDSPLFCPDPKCNVTCVHGQALDPQGCPTCECYDPCLETRCKEDETCELVYVPCENGTCSPLARCVPSPQCPGGAEPLQAPDGSGPVQCGPQAAACPFTHACRFAPHDTQPSVCCPKPRSVCFESKDEGICEAGKGFNATRWHFNHEHNRCERFRYHGCSGNHNNFRSKEECNIVCPVLSPCERLREKNEALMQKFGTGAFLPECDSDGAWAPVQCMSNIDVCWCVNARGEPQKGSLVRGARPSCNFRQARKLARRDPLDERARADEILEELIRQMTSYRSEELDDEEIKIDDDLGVEARKLDITKSQEIVDEEETVTLADVAKTAHTIIDSVQLVAEVPKTEKISFKTKCQLMQEEVENSGEGLRPRCLSDGSFAPRQCSRGRCWCVDAAGQRRTQAGHVADNPAADPCEQTQIESAQLELEFLRLEGDAAERARTALTARLTALGARVPVTMVKDKNVTKLRATLSGPRSVDVVYQVENMVKQEKLSNSNDAGVLAADFIRSEYRLASPPLSMQQREIVTESTVSAATSYHTALIVLAATSAFIISVLCVLVMLYRARLQREPHKAERFLPPAPPVYVLSADEKAELARVLHPPHIPPPVPPPEENSSKV